jgi:ubiquinone/menaquinone biosynthesis C-methylase UbiE
MWIILLVVALLLATLIWEIWVCEGAHLGRHFVVWMYNISASRYDGIKKFDHDWERRFLGEPVLEVLSTLPDPIVLDVGAGTGRMARILLAFESYDGTIINLEPAQKMVALGQSLTHSDQAPWIRAWAVPLPFPEKTFDLVTSLEILEFTPDPRKTLLEMLRVTRPGGWMMVSNRIGKEAPLILGQTFEREAFGKILEELGLTHVQVYPWQEDYDLAWAMKPVEETVLRRA